MNNSTLKQDIIGDLETLKKLDVEIMPAKQYYRLTFSLFCKMFFIFYITALGGCILYNQGIALCMLWLPLFVTMILTLFNFCYINDYIIFKYQIKPKLKTGDLILKKIKFTVWLFFILYIIGVWSVSTFFGFTLAEPSSHSHAAAETVVTSNYHPSFAQWIFLILYTSAFPFGGFLVACLLAQNIVWVELKRTGISILFTIIQKYFDYHEEEKTKNITWPKK